MTEAAVPTPACAAIRVLASGSGGNCAVLAWECAGRRRALLIDAGIGARRVRALLERSGLTVGMIDAVLLTHLDTDHWNAAFARALPEACPVYVHRSHRSWALAGGVPEERVATLDGPAELSPGLRVGAELLHHDERGVACFRFDLPGGTSLGYATDVGRVTRGLIDHLRAVDVLAIESNYCPVMQRQSTRPAFLKRRIMGGSGHLSNQQSASAVGAIGPTRHVVLLHLSRECNRPDLAAAGHAGAPYGLTISSQHRPTPWVRVERGTPWRAADAGPAVGEALLWET